MQDLPHPAGGGEGHLGDLGHVHAVDDSNTIWARRQVTTEPELRRTMRNRRLPSSLVISRIRTPSRNSHLLAQQLGRGEVRDPNARLLLPQGANVGGGGTS